jgi:hypothetical protein
MEPFASDVPIHKLLLSREKCLGATKGELDDPVMIKGISGALSEKKDLRGI